MTVRRFYELGVARLAVDAEREDFLAGFEHFLGGHRVGMPSPPLVSVTIQVGTPGVPPPSAEILYRGPLLEEGDCLFARLGDTYFMSFPDEASLEIDTLTGNSAMIVSPAHPQRALSSMVAIATEFACDRHGQQFMHAAGLAIPEANTMVVVTAPSGTGKTTTALALSRHGFALAADDVLALRDAGAGIVALGLPRALNVHRRTVEMLPWLPVGDRWNRNDEQPILVRQLDGVTPLESRELPVSLLVLLRRGVAAAVDRLPAAEALAAIAADNVRGSLAGLTPPQGRRFSMLSQLARTTPACIATLPDGLEGIEYVAEALKDRSLNGRA